MCTNGMAGRFRTYKGYELCQRPVPLLAYGASGSFACLLTATSILYLNLEKKARFFGK
jgi:hypothetical protein